MIKFRNLEISTSDHIVRWDIECREVFRKLQTASNKFSDRAVNFLFADCFPMQFNCAHGEIFLTHSSDIRKLKVSVEDLLESFDLSLTTLGYKRRTYVFVSNSPLLSRTVLTGNVLELDGMLYLETEVLFM
jgi:hypothetical protein